MFERINDTYETKLSVLLKFPLMYTVSYSGTDTVIPGKLRVNIQGQLSRGGI